MIGYSLFLLSVIYSGFLIWVLAGWNKINPTSLKLRRMKGEGSNTTVSVIIPVRNEQEHIYHTLTDIINQKYPRELFEIIVVNDHSTDATVSQVNKFMEEYVDDSDVKVTFLDLKTDQNENFSFKKYAITEAVKIAKGELIITTDADCTRTGEWLPSFVSMYEEKQSLMISAPVRYNCEFNWFEMIQALEFMGLIAIGAGCISNKQPMLCNGANLAFTKDIFFKVDGYNEKGNVATGDDTQLLRKIAAVDKNRIHFLKSEDAVVGTDPKSSWKELFNQRKRWASKIPTQMSGLALFMGIVAYLLHLGLIAGIILAFFGFGVKGLLISFLLKVLAEFLLLNSIARLLGKQNLLWLLLPAQLYYMIYIVVVGVASVFGKYEWKGRRI